ncbi:MAG: metallophosphatase family protein, partial [Bacteroidales bacterium]|nr:metallophosphatase family protein [Bacteroidales bacterium]
MTRVGVLSDTHSTTHERVFEFLKDCDQLWHAGDIGNLETLDKIAQFKPTIAVFGNCDGAEIIQKTQKYAYFTCENKKVMMTHIGGYPGRYPAHIEQILREKKPDIFVAGHSHILKVIYDKKHQFLFLNPGAAGQFGFHKSITALRFCIDQDNIT